MSKILLGDLITDMRGSTGGNTYSKGVGGCHIRKNKVIPSISTTERQMVVRGEMSFLSNYWRELSDEQRSAWSTYAGTHPIPDVFGVPRIYPGYEYFEKFNFFLLENGLDLMLDAPLAEATPLSPEGYIEGSAGAGEFSLQTDRYFGSTNIVDVWKFGPASAGRHPQISDVRHLCYMDIGTAGLPQVFSCAEGRVTIFARAIHPELGLISPFARLAPLDVTA
jgi:hypothetical protein